jgi:hypothetical protein
MQVSHLKHPASCLFRFNFELSVAIESQQMAHKIETAEDAQRLLALPTSEMNYICANTRREIKAVVEQLVAERDLLSARVTDLEGRSGEAAANRIHLAAISDAVESCDAKINDAFRQADEALIRSARVRAEARKEGAKLAAGGAGIVLAAFGVLGVAYLCLKK